MFDTDLLTAVAQFRALGEQIAAAIDSDTSGPLAVEALAGVHAGTRLGELATVRLIERIDRTGEFAADGSASTVAYLRGAYAERSAWASRRVPVGRALADRLPATGESWQRGALGLDHASVIQQTTAKLDDELAADIESALASAAECLNPTELAGLADMVKAQAAPDAAADDAATRRASQRLSLSQTLDGMWRLDGWLDSEAGMILSAALAAFTRKHDPDADVGADPIGLRRAEALTQMARHAIAHSEDCNGQAASRHTTVVTMTLEQLRTGIGAAHVDGGTTITAAAARRLACEGNVIPAVLGTGSEILDLGRERRLASPRQRLAIGLRDNGCLWPTCDRPPAQTEAHHRTHHIHGGPTEPENLDSLCTFHHHLVHEGGWTYTVTHNVNGTDTLTFTPPGDGLTRTTTRRSMPTPTTHPKAWPKPRKTRTTRTARPVMRT